jgi:hypothetical protein
LRIVFMPEQAASLRSYRRISASFVTLVTSTSWPSLSCRRVAFHECGGGVSPGFMGGRRQCGRDAPSCSPSPVRSAHGTLRFSIRSGSCQRRRYSAAACPGTPRERPPSFRRRTCAYRSADALEIRQNLVCRHLPTEQSGAPRCQRACRILHELVVDADVS